MTYDMNSEREAIITALLEELEEIGDDLEDAKEHSVLIQNLVESSTSNAVAQKLQETLKKNRSRPPWLSCLAVHKLSFSSRFETS